MFGLSVLVKIAACAVEFRFTANDLDKSLHRVDIRDICWQYISNRKLPWLGHRNIVVYGRFYAGRKSHKTGKETTTPCASCRHSILSPLEPALFLAWLDRLAVRTLYVFSDFSEVIYLCSDVWSLLINESHDVIYIQT